MEKRKNQGRLLVAEDLSSIGSISLQAALPLFQAADVPTAILPTSILSTQGEGFGQPVVASGINDWARAALKHWQRAEVEFSGCLIGYYNQREIGDQLNNYLAQNKLDFVVVDPAFADQGKPYSLQGRKHIKSLLPLLARANYSTPNLTEACLLTGRPQFDGEPDSAQLTRLLEAYNDLLAPGGQAVITGIVSHHQIGSVWLKDGRLETTGGSLLDGHFFGSGDVFAAVLTIMLWQGQNFDQAARIATDLTHRCLAKTQESGRERRYGLMVSPIIKYLQNNSKEA